jgi:hypothetical protein
VQAWAMEVLERDDDGMEQSLFSLHLLYDSIVGSVSNDILNSDEINSQFDLITSFQQYMRTLQLKGYLTWSIALDIITQDPSLAMIPVQKFVSNTDQQRNMMEGEDNYNSIISKSFVGFRSVIFQSYIRVPHQMFHVSTQAFQDDWERLFIQPQDDGTFLLKSKPFGTYLKANPGVGEQVDQVRESSAPGVRWRIVKLENEFARNYFGSVSGIKTVHGTLWAEGRTRAGKSVLTTAKRVSDLTQFNIAQIEGSNMANIISPTGMFVTREPSNNALKLLPESSELAEFEIEQIDDKFFALKTTSGHYARSSPGALGRVDAVPTTVGEWTKLARVNAPGNVYQIISEYDTFLYVTGPPQEDVEEITLATGEDSPGAKWEIDAPWTDLPGLFETSSQLASEY